MLVLDQKNTYSFSNMVIQLVDNTVIQDENADRVRPLPDFSVLIPTVQPVGMTNTMEIYWPGELAQYRAAHGTPNALKYGFGPDIIFGILSRGASKVGVYTVNLRGPSATAANIMVLLKYRVETDVPYTDTEGNPYYVDANGQLVLTPTDATPVVRDVLHVKFVTASNTECKKWMDMVKAMNSAKSDVEDDEGYKTMPFFAVMYKGTSSFGNNVYFNLAPRVAEFDQNMYYSTTLFDGMSTYTTDANFSLDADSGKLYNANYFIENQFNSTFQNLKFISAQAIDEVYDLFNQYLYTLDDFINGNMDSPSVKFPAIDPFNCNTFGVVVDSGSLNSQIPNAFKLVDGTDGTETPDELYEMFFRGDIVTDIASVLRYKFHYIPDINFNTSTKKEIINLVQKRIRMTTATLMVGGEDTFESAIIDHQANYWENMPNIRLLAKAQCPMMYNEYVHRTITYPAIYFDVMACMDHFIKWGNFFQPFAGADARWSGYIEDTMLYPPEDPTYINSLHINRINYVMKDSEAGGYLADQQMNTQLTSDQTEFNNSFLIACMLYDLVNLVHRNNFKFNEAEEVRSFNIAVNDCINTKYALYSASLQCEVYRIGTVGRAKSANKIVVTIDMKDISKYTECELILVDE